eukprot:TRINITY_DN218_c0_g1_i1.p1 TRINITY_DN218_c0_g1~~TRINITY_DN218_c0_g1_i1.p1  ORF type:complete len:308 (+),score=74.14 TRINITY_DN218_c0_g1_i1:46-969(+)
MENRVSKKPAATAFKQQQLKAWQPILTPIPVIITFMCIGIIFIPIGIALLVASNSVVEVSQRYDNIESCPINSTCTVTLDITKKMKAPVYFYYKLENYYQNHRRYVKSRNDQQLRGDVVTSYSALADCDPLISEGDSSEPAQFFLPCGLIARSLFNDTFSLKKGDQNITLRKEGIAWSSDVRHKFKNPPNGTAGIRVIADFEDEDFIVWMRTAGLPNFKKLYRIIDEDLDVGTYQVNIENHYPVASFKGKKYVVLSTTSWIGGKNSFLGWAYITVGIICIIQGILFGIKQAVSPRKLGDTKYLDWNK